jgi:zinc transport system substrate-binding protein
LFLLACLLPLHAVPAFAETVTAWRLFVSDLNEPVVRALDATSGELLGTFGLPPGAVLQPGASTSIVYAVNGPAGSVAAIATGIAFDDHGDHFDAAITPPVALDWRLDLDAPLIAVASAGRAAFFATGDGTARFFAEPALLRDRAVARLVATAAPHSGVAAALANHLIVSVPAGNLTAIRVLDLSGRRAAPDVPCVDIAAAAASATAVAVACRENVLVFQETGGAVRVRSVPLPANAGRTSQLRGAASGTFIALLPRGIFVLVADLQSPEQVLELPSPPLDAVVAPTGARVFALTAEGGLYSIDDKGALAAFATMAPPSSQVVPTGTRRLAFVDDLLAVTDPLAGEVRLIDPKTLSLRRRIAVPGAPLGIVAVGGSAEVH